MSGVNSVCLQPGHQVLHVEGSIVEELEQGVVDRCRVGREYVAVDSQEDIDHGESDSFVAVDERMVLNETFQECCGFVDDRVVVTSLRSRQCRFERSGVANARSAAVALNQYFVEEKSVCRRDVLRHLASDRYSSSRSLRLS